MANTSRCERKDDGVALWIFSGLADELHGTTESGGGQCGPCRKPFDGRLTVVRAKQRLPDDDNHTASVPAGGPIEVSSWNEPEGAPT